MRKLNNTTARVIITLEVHAGTWGETCAIGQVFDQAKSAAVGRVTKLIEGAFGVSIVGTPKVTAVMSEKCND